MTLRVVRDEPPGDGCALLDELERTIRKFVVFANDDQPVAVTLWIAVTHALPAFDCAPRLVIKSPEKRCGKTRLLDIVEGTCHRPLASVDATVAAIFRSLGGDHPPTLIIDEADAIFGSKKVAEQNEDLRKLINAGHQRGKPALRCVGASQIPTEFDTFAMVALAGIGAMPDTITDRAVNLTLRRRAADETVAKFRLRRDKPTLVSLGEELADWVEATKEKLQAAEPVMPVEDRAADTWEPLIAVADAAGGRWPDLARAACKALVAEAESADEDSTLAIRLLRDVRDVFGDDDRMFSIDIVARLIADDEWEWSDLWGKPLDQNRLAKELKRYGVRPKDIRIRGANAKGYTVAGPTGLGQAWARYLPTRDSRDNRDNPGQGDSTRDTIRDSRDKSATPETTCEQSLFENVAPVTGVAGIPPDSRGGGRASSGFQPPRGPDRCASCGYHVPTQGHRDDCPANHRAGR